MSISIADASTRLSSSIVPVAALTSKLESILFVLVEASYPIAPGFVADPTTVASPACAISTFKASVSPRAYFGSVASKVVPVASALRVGTISSSFKLRSFSHFSGSASIAARSVFSRSIPISLAQASMVSTKVRSTGSAAVVSSFESLELSSSIFSSSATDSLLPLVVASSR